jgi:hypothetical protein
MATDPQKPVEVPQIVQIPGLAPVEVVAIRLPDGTIALRHPSELQKPTPPVAPAPDNR